MADPDEDEYGHAFGVLLRSDEAPVPDRDLVGATLRTARLVRRRRHRAAGGVVLAGLAAVLIAVLGTGAPLRTVQPATPTVAVPTQPTAGPATPTRAPTGAPRPAVVEDAALDQLPAGNPAGIGWLQDGVWHQPDGRSTPARLPRAVDQAVQAFAFDGGLFLTGVTPAARRSTLIIRADGTSSSLATQGHAFTRGPAGSLLWLETTDGTSSVVRLNPDRSYQRWPVRLREPDSAVLHAARDTLFVADDGAVTRYTVRGPALTDPTVIRDAETVIPGDPASDEVILVRSDLCTAVVAAGDQSPHAWACRDRISAVSPDGKHRYGYDTGSETGVVTDSSGAVVRRLLRVGSIEATFDAGGRLLLVGGAANADGTHFRAAVLGCLLPEPCRRLSGVATGQIDSGVHPIVLVR